MKTIHALSENNMIPLCHNHTTGAVYSKISFKVEICSAHYNHFIYSDYLLCTVTASAHMSICDIIVTMKINDLYTI